MASKSKGTQFTRQSKLLKEEELLLGEWICGPVSVEWCAEPVSGGFLLASSEVEQWASPWIEGPLSAELPFEAESRVTSMQLDHCAKYLAMGTDKGGWKKAQLWDWPRKTLVKEVDHSSSVGFVDFSPDGRLLVTASSAEIAVTSTADLAQVAFRERPFGWRCTGLHPSGFTLVGGESELALMQLPSLVQLKALCVGRKRDSSAAFDYYKKLVERKMEEVGGIAGMEELMRKSLEQSHRKNEALVREAGREIERQIEAVNALSVPGVMGLSTHGSEAMTQLEFNRDGGKLLLATDRGFRVYSWESILAAAEETPPPLIAIEDSADVECGDTGSIARRPRRYEFALDDSKNLLLYSGKRGEINFYAMDTNRRGILLEPFGGLSFSNFGLSWDGTALICRADGGSPRKRSPSRFQVWNYHELCARAGV